MTCTLFVPCQSKITTFLLQYIPIWQKKSNQWTFPLGERSHFLKRFLLIQLCFWEWQELKQWDVRPALPSQYIDIFFFLRKIIQLYRKLQVHSHFGKTLDYLEINQSICLSIEEEKENKRKQTKMKHINDICCLNKTHNFHVDVKTGMAH